MTDILLTSESYLRDNLPISRNIDFKIIRPNVISAQELYTQDILGSDFYQHILTAFSGQTLTPNEEILVQNYIKPHVAYRSLSMTLPFVQNQIVNKGVQKQREDYSDATSFEEFRFLLHNVDNRAEFYEEYLVKYLCENSELFPQYKSQPNALINPNPQNGWNSGLVFY
jgi:hypothetical protein